MKIVITNKDLKVEITIDADSDNGHQVNEQNKLPVKPTEFLSSISLKDKAKMDEQVKAAMKILAEE